MSEESAFPFIRHLIQNTLGGSDWCWIKPDKLDRNSPAVDFLFTSEKLQKTVAVEHTTFDGFDNQRLLGKIFIENRNRIFQSLENLIPDGMTIHLGLSPNIFLRTNSPYFESNLVSLVDELNSFTRDSIEGESRQFRLPRSEILCLLYHRRHNIHLDSNLILTALNPNVDIKSSYRERIKKVLEDKLPKLKTASVTSSCTVLAIEDVDPLNSCYSFFEENFRSMLNSIEWFPDFIFYFESDTSKIIEGSIMFRNGKLLTFSETEDNFITNVGARPS